MIQVVWNNFLPYCTKGIVNQARCFFCAFELYHLRISIYLDIPGRKKPLLVQNISVIHRRKVNLIFKKIVWHWSPGEKCRAFPFVTWNYELLSSFIVMKGNCINAGFFCQFTYAVYKPAQLLLLALYKLCSWKTKGLQKQSG